MNLSWCNLTMLLLTGISLGLLAFILYATWKGSVEKYYLKVFPEGNNADRHHYRGYSVPLPGQKEGFEVDEMEQLSLCKARANAAQGIDDCVSACKTCPYSQVQECELECFNAHSQ